MVYRRHLFSLQAGSPILSFTLQPGTSLSYIIGSSLCKKLLKPLNIEFLVAILIFFFLPIIIEDPSFSIIQSLQQRLFEMPQTKMKLA